MAICHECGSEVAELDTFCPFCGISLDPLPVAGDAVKDEMASTIVMSAAVLTPAAEPAPAETVAEAASEVASDPISKLVTTESQADVDAQPQPEQAMESFVSADELPTLESIPESITVPDAISVEEPADHQAQPSPETTAEPFLSLEDQPTLEAIPEAVTFSEAAAMAEPAIPHEQLEPEGREDSEPDLLTAEVPEEAVSVLAPESLVIEELVLERAVSEAEASPAAEEPVADVLVEIATDPDAEMEALFQSDVEETPAEEEVASVIAAEQATDSDASVPVTGETLGSASNEPATPVESGEILADGGTTPNIGGSDTDGRRSGLKPLSEGTLLNARYKIMKKIGGGGMGAVYLATDQNLGGTHRAVKEMVQSHIEEEQQAKAIEDFKRESMILSTLDHPSIPTIYDYFYDEPESRFYLVMKYISGGDLAARLRSAPEGRIDERTVTEWALQIIDVLDYLHSLPTTIVYRDLKPSNVMMDGNTGRIMLVDFGIARSINQTQEKGVTAVGTMGYAPPELFSGQVEPRSDIYSLGSTMFHLLTGADPQNNPLLIFDFQKNPRPRQINPRLSDQMERILMRSVEYNAEARFPSAADMKRALLEHLDNLRTGNVTHGISEIPAAVSLANQSVFCGFCGQRIVATDLFCAFCGSKQPIAQQGVHSEIYARGGITARLIIDGTSELEIPAFSLEKNENLVGRRDPMSNIFPEVDLSKYDPQTKISRRHARIWREGSAFLVEDLGSSNGTVLMSPVSDILRLVPHQPHPLANGDRLRIGDTTLHFVVG